MATTAKRVAIVTGSSRGIGEAIVRRLAKENYRVCVNDIAANSPGINSLVAELNSTHGDKTAVGIVADVTKQAEVRGMIKETVEKLGPLTCMVANAGVAHVKPCLEVSEEEVRSLFDVNVMGVWNCYTEAAKQMISQGPVPEGSTGYKLLAAASIVAFKPFPLLSHYSSSKWAVRGLTQVFAMELARHQIAVNAYAPGIVGTAMWDLIDEKLAEVEAAEHPGAPKPGPGEMRERYVMRGTAMGRTSVPDDVAKVVGGFLAGKDSEFVTGQTLVVDGGIIFT